MANTTERVIKTIILLRSDSEKNLIANGKNLILRKGEVCLTIPDDPTKPASGKVGTDGVTCWADLPYSFGPLANNGSGSGDGVNFTPDGKTLQLTADNILQIIGANTAQNGESFRISQDGTTVEWFVAASDVQVQENKTLIQQLTEKVNNDYYTKDEVDAKVGAVFTFKGSVDTKSDLDTLTGMQAGDSYIVKDENKLYSYSETDGWQEFPLGVDLTKYVLVTDFTPVKETVESLPDTLIARLEAIKAENGDIEIRTIESNKGEDGKYSLDSEHTILRLNETVANGPAGLLSGRDKAKLDMLVETSATGGQANIIESVKIAGTDLPVDGDKTVNIPVAGENYGVVKNHVENSEVVNKVVVAEDGTMSVPEIQMDTLIEGDVIISGGSAAG